MDKISMEDLANFCKQKGFIYPSGEIYGSLAGFWDYGHLGAELRKNIKDSWWQHFIRSREDITGIDGSIITNPKVWEASGHVENFVDIAVVCKKCKNKFKVDESELKDAVCDKCGGEVESKGKFVPMFTTQVGPIETESLKSYLRPETAQLIFTNFRAVQENARMKLPFGIAQIGKAFRNEIAPRNFIFRNREFEQMEIEYFIDPDEKDNCPFKVPKIKLEIFSSDMQLKKQKPKIMTIDEALEKKLIKLKWHAYWLATSLDWYKGLGADMKNFRIRQHLPDEKSHYSTDTWDIEYNFPFGWKELQGIADRGTYDLTQHQNKSKKSMEIMDDTKGKKVLPMVVAEPSFGVERAFLVFLLESYKNDKKRGNLVLNLSPKLSPVKAAIFPLVKNEKKIVKLAKSIYDNLKEEFNVEYDAAGSVGRRYARQDETGTPFCITVDHDSLKDNKVTIRDRDSTKQKRISIEETNNIISNLIRGKTSFSKL